MRRLVNNWLYGEVSQLLTGRLDTDIYSAGCSRLENMYVHRQGGISRRPPLKVIRQGVASQMSKPFTRMIPFNISSEQSYILYLSPQREGSIPDTYTSDIYIDNGVSVIGFSSFFVEPFASKYRGTWGALSVDELMDVRYAVYYDSLYLVHKNCPLLRIRCVTSSYFTIEFPDVKVNQDVRPYDITLSVSSYVASSAGTYYIYVAGRRHAFTRTSTMTLQQFLDTICSISYYKWTATRTGDTVLFEPEDKADKYREFKLASSSSTASERAEADFKLESTSSMEFSYAFSATADEDETGIVYGQDDFLDMELNTQYNYASNIKIASERMWLVVNSNPCRIYVSRPYGTSQIISPRESNDTILDFIQFQLVATTSEKMKDENLLPVKLFRDTNNSIVYRSNSQSQRLWQPSADTISTKEDYDNAVEARECTVTMGNLPDYEGGQTYWRVATIAFKDGSTPIEWSIYYHITDDDEVDYSKLQIDANGDYWSNIYKYESGGSYINPTANNTGSQGLIYRYYHVTDVYVVPSKTYFVKTGDNTYTKVETASQEDISTYYERKVEFVTPKVIYEKKGAYVFYNSDPTAPKIRLDVDYDDVSGIILKVYRSGIIYCEALPYYVFDMATDSKIYDTTTEVDKVATSSTGMDLQFATGRNDRITWIGLADSIMVGTESSEHRIDYSINALDNKQDKYSDYGSIKGLECNLGRDLVFLQKGNKLRLLYKDNWGLQNLELTITNPDIMEGEVVNIVSINEPEPAIAVLKRVASVVDNETVYTYSIVYISIDRANGIQAFARWDFSFDILDICMNEYENKQRIVALCSEDGKRFTAYFDFSEKSCFADCGNVNTTIVNGTHGYTSIMRANPFDTQTQDGSVTIGENKNVSKIVFRCLDTGKVITWYNEKDRNISRTPICCDRSGDYVGGLADFSMNVNGGTTTDLMIAVEAYENEPMTLLAMAYELRVNRNG